MKERGATILCGLFGALLLVGSARAILTGSVHLRRYEAPLAEAWPIIAILTILGFGLLIGAAFAWRQGE